MYPKTKNNDRPRHEFIAKVRAACHAWEQFRTSAESAVAAMEKISKAMKEFDSQKTTVK